MNASNDRPPTIPRASISWSVTGVILFVLIFAPIAFGTVEPWSLFIVEAGCVAAFLLQAWILYIRQRQWRDVPGLMPLLLLLAFMALQLVPFPQSVLSVFSPGSFRLNGLTVGVFQDDWWASISIERRATLLELLRYTSCAVLYIAGIQLMSNKKGLKLVARTVVLFAAAVAFISLLNKFSSSHMLLWMRTAPDEVGFFGPFVSKNHYAAYMGMVFPLAVGLFMAYSPRVSGGVMDMLKATAQYRRLHMHLIFGFASVLIATSVFVSLSRAGVIALCVSMVFMAALLVRRNVGLSLPIGVIFLFAAVLVGWFGWDTLVERFGLVVGNDALKNFNRSVIWTDSIRAFRDYPFMGAGFGSFGSVYPAYRSLPWRLVVDHAHNDYLELLVEGGLVSFVLATWFVLAVFMRVLSSVRKRREHYCVIMGVAGVSAMIYMLVHALSDFNMHIGSNALYFFFVAAFAVSASHTRLRGSGRSSLLKKRRLKNSSVITYAISIAGLAIVLVNVGVLAGSYVVRNQSEAALLPGASPESLAQARDKYALASMLDPLNALYRVALARTNGIIGDSSLVHYEEAVGLQPTDARVLHAAAFALGVEGKSSSAEALMRAALHYGSRRHDKHLWYAAWLLDRSRYAEAQEVVRQGIALEPARTESYARMLMDKGLSGPEVMGALPEMARPHVLLASFFVREGDPLLVDDVYWRALDLLIDGDVLMPWEYRSVSRHFLAKGRRDAALTVALMAVEGFPDVSYLKVGLGMVYERQGDLIKAREEYERALTLDPTDLIARKRLENISDRR